MKNRQKKLNYWIYKVKSEFKKGLLWEYIVIKEKYQQYSRILKLMKEQGIKRMSQVVSKLNEIMVEIHNLHTPTELELANEYCYDYEELNNKNSENKSYMLFHEFEKIVAQEGSKSLEYFRKCNLKDFCVYAYHCGIGCREKGFYAPILCDVLEEKLPKDASKKLKRLKEDIRYALLELQHYFDTHDDKDDIV